MTWKPTNQQILELHTRHNLGMPIVDPEHAAPLVKEGLLTQIDPDTIDKGYPAVFKITNKGRQYLNFLNGLKN